MSPTQTAASPPVARPHLLRRVASAALAAAVAIIGVLIVAWLILHWAILPHIDAWRPQVEARASAALGVEVRIGAIRVQGSGWMPALELDDVVLHDAAGRESLRLPRVAASISPRSLLSLQLRFEQLLLDGPRLEVRRDANGRLSVAGMAFDTAGDGDGSSAAADWFFAQREFIVRAGSLRWIDDLRHAAPPLELDDVSLVVRNGLRRHDLRLDATPPPAWGERVTLIANMRQSLLARAGDWRRWSGTLHANLPRADVQQLRRHADLPFELSGGGGALRAWLVVDEGEPRAATLDLALADVSMRLGDQLQSLAFRRVEGRLDAQRRDGDGFAISAERFSFTTADDVQWPAGRLALVVDRPRGSGDGDAASGEFSADRIDLALAASVASRLPLGAALQALLGELQPRGVVSGLSARWEGPLDAPRRYSATARIVGLAVAARPSAEAGHVGRPGIVNAEVELQASEAGGNAKLAVADGAFELPGVLEQPLLPMQRFDAKLDWRIGARGGEAPPKIELQVRDARFANDDAAGELSASWSTGIGSGLARGGRFPGQLRLAGKLERGRAAAVARYLPLGVPVHARRYVERAVKSGSVASATFRVQGDLWDFPFYASKAGEFRIAAKVRDVELDYIPSVPAGGDEPAFASPWPGLARVSGELVFDRASMQIRDASARLWGLELSRVQGGIADLVHAPALKVAGSARGPLADGLRFVNASPVGPSIGGALAEASASGNAKLELVLDIPLVGREPGKVEGSIALAGNDVRVQPGTPLFANARGRVDFSDRGFAIVGGAARLFGGDATFDGGSRPDGSLRFDGQGVATADGLRAAGELALLSRLASALSGQTAYKVALGFVRGRSELAVTSNLVGLASALPAPLGKAAAEALPMRYQTALAADAAGDTLRFELGSQVQARYERALAGDAARVLRGGIGVGAAAPPAPADGVHANVEVPSLDAAAWQAALAAMASGGSADAAQASAGYAPTRIDLRAQQLVAEGRKLTRLVAQLAFADGAWRAKLDADQLAGHGEWRPPQGGTGGKVIARLSRLALPEHEAQAIDALLDAEPAAVPALDIVIDDFELRGRKLGRLEIEAANRGDAQQREWRLARLALVLPEARFGASGQWINTGAANAKRRRSALDFQLDLADSGALLERLGFGRVVRGGKGRLAGRVSWDGSPLALDMPTLAGDINVALEAGQFLKVDPGAARLLGVLSLQSLPRRLALDFRDLFQQGFAFDDVSGDLRIAGGVARTNNLRMRGAQALVLMEGSADLGREMQDLRVFVVPEIDAGTAALATAVINPAIGIGAFLAQMVLRRPVMQAATREFHITGAWADPKVERIERRFDAPLPEGAAANSAAAERPQVRTP